MDYLPPPDEKADAGGEEAGAEAGVEPGDEGVGDLREAFEGDAEGDHEGDDEVAFDAEGLEDRCPGFRHRQDAAGVAADHAGEHKPEAGKDQGRQEIVPPRNAFQLPIIVQADNGDPGVDGRPQEAVDQQEVFCRDFQHSQRPNWLRK